MKKVFEIVWQDNFSRRGFGIAVFFWLSTLFLLVGFGLRLPPQVPLFYSHPWGEEQLASPVFLFLLPGGIFLILMSNLVATLFFSEEKLLLRILALASGLCSFLAFYGLIRILILSV